MLLQSTPELVKINGHYSKDRKALMMTKKQHYFETKLTQTT